MKKILSLTILSLALVAGCDQEKQTSTARRTIPYRQASDNFNSLETDGITGYKIVEPIKKKGRDYFKTTWFGEDYTSPELAFEGSYRTLKTFFPKKKINTDGTITIGDKTPDAYVREILCSAEGSRTKEFTLIELYSDREFRDLFEAYNLKAYPTNLGDNTTFDNWREKESLPRKIVEEGWEISHEVYRKRFFLKKFSPHPTKSFYGSQKASGNFDEKLNKILDNEFGIDRDPKENGIFWTSENPSLKNNLKNHLGYLVMEFGFPSSKFTIPEKDKEKVLREAFEGKLEIMLNGKKGYIKITN